MKYLLILLGLLLGIFSNSQSQNIEKITFSQGSGTFNAIGGRYVSITIGESVTGSLTSVHGAINVGFKKRKEKETSWKGITAEWEDSFSNLSWWITNPTNQHFFEIERSFDGQIFMTIGQFKAIKEQNEYGFIDTETPSLNSLQFYYRVKIINPEGEFSYSEVVSLKKNFQGPLLGKVFPNPTSGNARFQYQGSPDAGNIHFTLLDNAGRIVWQIQKNATELQSDMELPMNNLPKRNLLA